MCQPCLVSHFKGVENALLTVPQLMPHCIKFFSSSAVATFPAATTAAIGAAGAMFGIYRGKSYPFRANPKVFLETREMVDAEVGGLGPMSSSMVLWESQLSGALLENNALTSCRPCEPRSHDTTLEAF